MTEELEKKLPKVDSTLSKGLSILEYLTASAESKGVSELSRELGLTKSNTYRLLQSLITLGYVSQMPDKNYAASLKTWQVGRRVIDQMNLRELYQEEMQWLSKQTGETVYLAVQDSLAVVYLDKIESLKPIRSWNTVGASVPLHCVGTGKAILSVKYEKLRAQLADALEKFTDKTITDIDKLDEDMAETRTRGYAFDCGEYREGILSFGAPILLPNREVIAAIGLSVPEVNLPKEGAEVLGKVVAEAALRASGKIIPR